LGAPIIFFPIFYGQLALLHLSLLIRVAGDLSGQMGIRRWGGMLNEVAILLFLATTIYSIFRSEK
jgi:hypothetical protein